MASSRSATGVNVDSQAGALSTSTVAIAAVAIATVATGIAGVVAGGIAAGVACARVTGVVTDTVEQATAAPITVAEEAIPHSVPADAVTPAWAGIASAAVAVA